ncbi:hypothetical protein D1AOALGA4SA_763 [Olavius algarvensis Delta 1 endosymbiont]|nr:hypothetical protein D1AOALGA4SA_763 [Olavius algarvensis Delta 1 endosymbiont]
MNFLILSHNPLIPQFLNSPNSSFTFFVVSFIFREIVLKDKPICNILDGGLSAKRGVLLKFHSYSEYLGRFQ